MITFETPEKPVLKIGEGELVENPDVVITISGVKSIAFLNIGFKSDDEEETDYE